MSKKWRGRKGRCRGEGGGEGVRGIVCVFLGLCVGGERWVDRKV